VKMSVKMSVKILSLIKGNSVVTIPELADKIGVTTRTIERYVQKLQQDNLLIRIGPDKGGHWEVVENKNDK